ncbi:virulence factor Mce family protein [Veillonellaceae bacterium DNF00751]|uniref:MlaD family protein n=1 Tax=uncultured Megasphaera sp. TaxID=165188 RepID=UPI0007865BCB|nr:MlaD family protein [uncultured Megasphaera sp.]KXB94087.1 virulence factor Mce family protein [Veillonellaceae bacterium DNF00751]
MKWNAEAKVGLVTIVGVLVFSYVIIDLAQAEIFGKPGYEVQALVADANGLQKGNVVRYAGVNVGRVEKVVPTAEGVRVTLKLNNEVKIPKDSQVSITTDGLMGEKIVSIKAGRDTTHYLQSGDRVAGMPAKTMADMMDSAGSLMNNANTMVENINAIVGDARTQQAVRGSLQHINGITAQTDALLQQNSGNIRQITQNMAALTGQMNVSLQRLDGDGATSENVRSVVRNMQITSAKLAVVADSLASVSGDAQTQSDIKTTLKNTAAISQKVNQLLSGNNDVQTTGEAGILYNTSKKETYGYANFIVKRNKKFILLGSEGIGNRTRMNLQYGTDGNLMDARWGLINGELGIGLDFFADGPLRLSIEGYNPNQWQYRFKGQYRVAPNVYLFGQITRPFRQQDGGNYYGLNYSF